MWCAKRRRRGRTSLSATEESRANVIHDLSSPQREREREREREGERERESKRRKLSRAKVVYEV